MGSDLFASRGSDPIWSVPRSLDAEVGLNEIRASLREGDPGKALSSAKSFLRTSALESNRGPTLAARASAQALAALAARAVGSERAADLENYVDQARESFAELLETDIELDQDAYIEAVHVFVMAQDYRRAADLASAALAAGKPVPPDVILQIVDSLDGSARADASLELLRAACVRFPDHVGLALALAHALDETSPESLESAWADLSAAQLLNNRGDFSQAEYLARRSLRASPDSAPALGALLQSLYFQDRPDAAIDEAQGHPTLLSESAEILSIYVFLLATSGHMEEAIRAGREGLLKVKSGQPILVNLLTQILVATDRRHEAVELASEFLEAKPDDPLLRYAKAQAMMSDDVEEALALLAGLVDEFPDVESYRLALARGFAQQEHFLPAIAALSPSVGSRSIDSDAMLEMRNEVIRSCLDYTDRHLYDVDPAQLKELLEGVLGSDPNNGEAHRLLAEILRRLGDYNGAIAHLDKAEELPPDPDDESWTSAWLMGTRGQVYVATGRLREAVDLFRRAIEVDDSQFWCVVELANALRLLGDSEQAREYATRATSLRPDDAWAWAIRGACEMDIGEWASSQRSLDEALKLAPRYGWVLLMKARLLAELDRFEEALETADASIESGYEEADAFSFKAWLLNITDGDVELEMQAGRTAVRLDPENVFAVAVLADALQRRREVSRARELYKQVVERVDEGSERDAGVLAIAGWSHLRLGNFDDALECFAASLALDGADVSTQFDQALGLLCAGRIEVSVGEYEAGIAHLRRKDSVEGQRSHVRVARHDIVSFIHDGTLADDESVRSILRLLDQAVSEVQAQ